MISSPTLIGPFIAIAIAWLSLAIAANQAAENAAQRREIEAIGLLIESRIIAEFEVAYDTARTSLSAFSDQPVPLAVAQRDLNVAKRTWAVHLAKAIENAPSPFKRTIFGNRGARSPEFDNYILKAFAPLGRYFMIGTFANFYVSEKQDLLKGFSDTIELDIHYLEQARAVLRKRMAAEGIVAERTTRAAFILRWLDERIIYLKAFSEEVKFVTRFARTRRLGLERRVRYISVRCTLELRKR
jgi:hypothetical protein